MPVHDFGTHIKSMRDLDNYTIEPGDPDPRGWAVVDATGDHIGTVDDLLIDTNRMKVEYLLVRLDGARAATAGGGTQAFIKTADVDLADRRVTLRAGTALDMADVDMSDEAFNRDTRGRHDVAGGRDIEDETRVTRSEEELRVGKREVERGEARVTKRVETERVSQPVTKRREELVVERRPVEAGTARDASIGEDEVRIPLREEEVVIDKRPVVKEELVVGKRVVEEKENVEADVRRERVDIEGEGRPRSDRGRKDYERG